MKDVSSYFFFKYHLTNFLEVFLFFIILHLLALGLHCTSMTFLLHLSFFCRATCSTLLYLTLPIFSETSSISVLFLIVPCVVLSLLANLLVRVVVLIPHVISGSMQVLKTCLFVALPLLLFCYHFQIFKNVCIAIIIKYFSTIICEIVLLYM